MSWSITSTIWVLVAVAINPAVATGDPPVVSGIPDQTLNEGESFATINLDDYVTDTDTSDENLTWSYSGNTDLSVDITDRVATITTPNADWFGSETITFRATDPETNYDEDSAVFTVTNVNDPPIAVDDSATTVKDTLVNIDVLDNDSDPEDDTLDVTGASDPPHGTADVQGDNTINYTPDSGFTGADSFTYDISDGNGGTDSATVNVTVPPLYVDSAVSSNTVGSGTSITIEHTTGTGANRLMMVGVSWNCGTTDRTISSVTFTPVAGEAVGLTEVITQLGYNTSNPRYSAIYSLLDPPSGQAGTVTVTFSGSVSNGIMAGAANFAGVNQTTPLGTPAGTNGNSTTLSVTLTPLNGDELVIDNVFLGAGSSSYELAVGPGQTELWNPAYIANLRAAASIEQAAGSSVTMDWTASTGNYWAIAAVPINPAPAGPTGTLTVGVSPSGGGTTVPSAGTHIYAYETVVDITATANTGYEFDHWDGDCSGADPDVCQVTMVGDRWVTAYFTAIPQYTLTVSTTGSGSVTLDPAGGTYYEGTTVTLTPVPGACYEFDSWSGADYLDLTDNGNGTWSISMTGNKSVTADFTTLPPSTPCYRVNCGGDTLTAPDPDFLALRYADLTSIPGLTVTNVQDERSTTDTIDMSNVDPGLPMELFQTILIRGTTGQTMTYAFEVPNGDYDLMLHFAEHYFDVAGSREFDISVEGVLVFDNYDIWVAAGGTDTAVTETVPVTVSDGVLTLEFTADVSDAAIRGIEIVTAEEVLPGTIIVEKQTEPDGWTDKIFMFTGDAAGTIGDGEQIVVSGLAPGAYSTTEAFIESGWTLSSITCDDSNSTGDLPSMTANFQLEAGETVKCTFNNRINMEYGDAPDTYQTLWASNGARHHGDEPDPFLGSSKDNEADGYPSASANGDDTHGLDDEDGVTLPATITAGNTAETVSVVAFGTGLLDAWIDFNGDGDFDHSSEHLWAGTSQALTTGTHQLTFAVPAESDLGQTFARFRYSSAGSLAPIGYAPDGEVEDYTLEIVAAPTTGTIIIEKQTEPDGLTDQVFQFTGDAAGTIGDGEQIVVSGLAPGVYSSQETFKQDGWTLSAIECDDSNSTVDLPTRTANFQLEAGETVTCTFYNRVDMDYGDAPQSYGTLHADNGARHYYPIPFLGSSKDNEADGIPSIAADADDINQFTDDEDGVTLPATITAGNTTEPVSVVAFGNGWLDAWIDFNGDGDFDHSSEHLWAGTSQALTTGTHQLTFAVPADADPGQTYARFRYSSAGSLAPIGYAPNGEVEDYRLEIEAGPTTGTIIVEKQTEPDGATESFEFDPSYGVNFTLSDNGTNDSGPLTPGTYSVEEINLPDGWSLTSATCSDSSDPDLIDLAAGETVKCTFYNLLELDYGDAPDSYGTLLASNGARHQIMSGRSLGLTVDAESDGQPTPNADGDDVMDASDDEDGVTLPPTLTAGDPAAQVTVHGGPNGGWLDAWIDFNGDGDFDHTSEHLWGGTSQYLISYLAGQNQLTFAVPADATLGTTFARFRMSNAGGLNPLGFAPDGEVEDYTVVIVDGTPPELTITGANANGDPMDGDLETGYILPTTNNPAIDHLIQFADGTSASEPLEDTYFGLYLTDSSVDPADLKAYYDDRNPPEPYLTYLKNAVDGVNPFVYIKGSTVTLVDAAKHDIQALDVDMTIPDDYPLGTFTVAGVIRDLAGNETTVTLILKVEGDRVDPTVTINQAAGQPDPTGTSPINFTVVFSEPVADFADGDVNLSISTTGGTLVDTITEIEPNNGTTYDVTVSGMTGSGDVIASIDAGVAHDAAGNPNAASSSTDNQVTYDIDVLNVTINQADTQADPTNASPIVFTVVFNKPVTDFVTGDVLLGGSATPTTQTVSEIDPFNGTTYSVEVSGMSGSGTVSASIEGGVAHDAADNPNQFSTSTDNEVEYDIDPPDTDIYATPPDPSNSSEATFEFSLVEAIVDSFECKLDGGDFESCSSPHTYYDLSEGEHTFQVRAVDDAGNVDPSPDSYTWTIDLTPPTVTINQADTQPDPTGTSPINFTVVFSEPVTDFTFGDVFLGGNAGATTDTVSEIAPNDGTTYNVAVSGMSGSGTVTANILPGVAHDAAGNPNESSTSDDYLVTYDIQPLNVTINQADTQADPTNASPIVFTVVFNKSVDDFETGDVLLDGSANPTTATVTGSGKTYSVEVSGMSGSGTVTASIEAGVAHDSASNPNEASTSTDNEVEYDIDPPDTEIISAPLDPSSSSEATFEFSRLEEVIYNFECKLDDGSYESCSSPHTYYDLAEGEHTFQVSAVDEAGNTDPTPDSYTWTIDLTEPDTTILTVPPDPCYIADASFSFESSEAGSTFACKLDEGDYETCTSPQDYFDLPDGEHTFYVRAIDEAGNTDSEAASYTWTVATNIRLIARPEQDLVEGYGWPVDTEVTLTIGETTYNSPQTVIVHPDNPEETYVLFDLTVGDVHDLIAGESVELSGGEFTKTHTVTALAITDIDVDGNTISGTTDSFFDVFVWVHGVEGSEKTATPVDDNWAVDFDPDHDLVAGDQGPAVQWDEDGDGTWIEWNIRLPHINAFPFQELVQGWDWPLDSTITLTINENEYTDTGTADAYPEEPDVISYVEFNLDGFDLDAGDVVVLTDGTTEKSLVVTGLTVDDANAWSDTVAGTTDNPSLDVQVWVYQDPEASYTLVTPDEFTGDWTADLSPYDLQPGADGAVIQQEEDRDTTWVHWNAPNPYLEAFPFSDEVNGLEWPLGTEVELYINSVYITSGIVGIPVWDPNTTAVEFDLNGEPDLVAGDEIELTGGGMTKTHTVTDLAVTSVNAATDTVSGTATSSDPVDVWAHEDYENSHVTVTPAGGVWDAVLTPFDIIPGTQGAAIQTDEDRDYTWVDWRVPNPWLEAYPVDNRVNGMDWPYGAEVELYINSEYIDTGTVDYAPGDPNMTYVEFDLYELHDLVAGDKVELTGAGFTKTHTVTDLVVTNVDTTSDTVSGITNPLSFDVQVWVHEDYENSYTTAPPDSVGDWTAELLTYDIQPGTDGAAIQTDEDGDITWVNWHASNPWIEANPVDNHVVGRDWQTGTLVQLYINSSYIDSGTVGYAPWDPYTTYVEFDLNGVHDLVAGDVVELTGGSFTKTLVVTSLAVTGVDAGTDTVTGTTDAIVEVELWVHEDYETSHTTATPDEFGDWSATLPFDIQDGTGGAAVQADGDGDLTWVNWHAPNPWIEVRPQANMIEGTDWPLGVAVTLNINSVLIASDTVIVNPWDPNTTWVGFDMSGAGGVAAGDEVELTDGGFTKLLTVTDLVVEEVLAGTDTVSGSTDDPALDVELWVHEDYETSYIVATPDEFGDWSATLPYDIQDGTGGAAVQTDDDGDKTWIDWHAPNPWLEAYSFEDRIAGLDWPIGTTVNLDIEDGSYTDSGFVDVAPWDPNMTWVEFDLNGVWDLQPGDVVELSGGDFTKIHTITALTVTDVDETANTLSGTTDTLVDVDVWLHTDYEGTHVTATPDGGGNWTAALTIDLVKGDEGAAVQADDDGDVTWVNWAAPYTLTLDTSGNGSITPDPAGLSYWPGTEVQLTAVADPGWAFSEWSGDLSGSDNPATIVMDGDKSVTATFVTLTCRTIDVVAGWNMLSVPLVADNMSLQALFPGVTDPAYYYAGSYQVVHHEDPMQNGVGYWLYFEDPGSYEICGDPVETRDIPVVAGWNMIGPFEQEVPVAVITTTPGEILDPTLWGYANAYVEASSLLPGAGYWAYLSEPGTLHLDGAESRSMKTELDPVTTCTMQWQAAIEVAGEGTLGSLLSIGQAAFASDDLNRSCGETRLPPRPLAEAFDARLVLPAGTLASRTDYRSSLGSTLEWRLEFQPGQSGAPLTINWNPAALPAGSWRLQDPNGGDLIDLDMTGQASFTLPDSGMDALVIQYVSATPVYTTHLPLIRR